VVGQNRGGDRIVTSNDGKVYFSNDHYANFTEFTP
jgi:guanyl-specific ribonuclease Sa